MGTAWPQTTPSQCPSCQSCCRSSSTSRQAETRRPLPDHQIQSSCTHRTWILTYRAKGKSCSSSKPHNSFTRPILSNSSITRTGSRHPSQICPHNRHLHRSPPREPLRRIPNRQRRPPEIIPGASRCLSPSGRRPQEERL